MTGRVGCCLVKAVNRATFPVPGAAHSSAHFGRAAKNPATLSDETAVQIGPRGLFIRLFCQDALPRHCSTGKKAT